MSADIGAVLRTPAAVAALVVGLVALKAVSLYLVGRLARLPHDAARALAVALSQGGEFAFVLFGIASAAGLMSSQVRDLLVVAVTISMMVTPPLYSLQARFRRAEEAPAYDAIDVPEVDVIIAGFGTFGQIFGRMLGLKKIPYTVLEKNVQQVEFVRQFGVHVFYSDAGRLEVLRAARADKARFFVLAIAQMEESLRVAESVRHHFPQLRILACAQDRMHAMRLMDLGITDVVRRSYFSSLEMTKIVLRALGENEGTIARDIERFRNHDLQTLHKQHAVYRDAQQLVQTAKDSARELAELFEADREERESSS
jgi:glutathione-regulated potassium-efflux system ancillary protein KefC/glutathione-regulated potassium-efflux system protein KefB